MQTGGIYVIDHTEYLLDNHVITEYSIVIVYTYMYINETSIISTWGSKCVNFVLLVGIFWSSCDDTEYPIVFVDTYMFINETSIISNRGSKCFIFVLLVGIFLSSCDNTIGWMQQDPSDNWTLVQVMAWCS